MFFTCFFFLVSSLTDSNVLQTINRKVLVHGKDRVKMIPCKFKRCCSFILILKCHLSPKEMNMFIVFREALIGLHEVKTPCLS